MGHQGSVTKKIQSIENLDQRVIRIVWEALKESGEDFRILVLPDHPTPIRVRTHTSDPVPYLLYDSTAKETHDWKYNEREGLASGNDVGPGPNMIVHLFE
jgi:2,3-bisphosphoglycerate-independent phosphoglycerate mutase